MVEMKAIVSALKLLFSQPFYLFLAIFISIVLFVIYFVLNNFSVFASILAISSDPALLWKVFTNHVEMVWEISGPVNVLAVTAVSFLAGINLSLTALRKKKAGVWVGRPGMLGFFGVFGGAFSAACSACNTALISVLGLSGGLALFPFQGLEISILAIALLGFSLYYISKSLLQFGVS